MVQQISNVEKSNRQRIQFFRDLELAEQVGKLPDCSLVGVSEMAPLTGIATSSLRKRSQRQPMNMPAPSLLGGRHLVWYLGEIRAWLNSGRPDDSDAPTPPERRQPGRPKKIESVRRLTQMGGSERAGIRSGRPAFQNTEKGAV